MRTTLLLLLMIIAMSTIAFGQNLSTRNNIDRLAKKMNETYSLTPLDRLGVLGSRLKVEIQHSIIEPEFESRWVKNFTGAERWLKSREDAEGFPRRYALQFKGCRAGICTFESEGGILHNQLYLKQIRYRFRGGRIVVTAIRFLDGD